MSSGISKERKVLMSDLSLGSGKYSTLGNNINSTGGGDGGETASKDNAESPDKFRRNIRVEFQFQIMKLRLQHRLAHAHFRILGVLGHSGPLIFVALFSGILSFLSASANEETEIEQTGTNVTEVVISPKFITPETREIFIIIVGILSLVQVAIQKIGQSLNHAARSDMHLQVEISLRHLFEELVFEENKAALDKDNPENNLTPETLSKFQALFAQCVASCSSPIPLKIAQPFDLIDHNIWMFMETRKLRKEKDIQFWISHAYNEIYAEICRDNGWQVNLPSTKKIIGMVEEKLEKQWMKIQTDLEKNNLCISDEMWL